MAEGFELPNRAMAIFAHPDDADFGCSATVALFAERRDFGAGAFAVIAVVSLVGLLIAVIAVGDLRERRAAEAMRLQSSVTGALRRQAAPIELHLTLNVHVPFWRGSPALIEVAGHVAAPEQRDVALGIVRAEVSRLRQDFVVEDRISITPR